MQAHRVHLSSGINGEQETVTVNLGRRQTFYAWCQVAMIDSLSDFDRDNAIAIDIVRVDGNLTGWRVSGGDHFGPDNAESNVRESAMAGFGQRITFRIRAFHKSDLSATGTGVVLTP